MIPFVLILRQTLQISLSSKWFYIYFQYTYKTFETFFSHVYKLEHEIIDI